MFSARVVLCARIGTTWMNTQSVLLSVYSPFSDSPMSSAYSKDRHRAGSFRRSLLVYSISPSCNHMCIGDPISSYTVYIIDL